LWGANAVNGVINIITKSARTTHGTTVTASAGSIDRGSISARYGGQFGEHTDYRVSTKFTNRGRTRDNGYGNPADDWRTGHVQARLDSTLSARDTVTIGGGVGVGEIGQSRLMVNGVMPWEQATITTPVEASQFNAMTRWTRTLSSGGDVVVDGSIDRVNRYETIIGAQITVATIDVQHHVRRGAHDLIVGAGQRVTFDRELTTLAFSMPRDRERIGLTNVFVQDEIALVPGLLAATLGSKMEYSTVSGGNFQPNARIAVTPNAHHTFWASAARAVRTPSRNERFMTYRYLNIATPELPMALAIAGNDALEPETLHAFEVGYRMQPVQWAHVDATAFVNRYLDVVRFQHVTSIETSPPAVHILDSLQYVNAGTASTRGVELSVDVRPLPQWQVTTGFSTLHARSAGDSSPALLAFPANAYSPTHQWFVASRASLGRDIEADATLFRVGDLPATPVPAYSRVDARLGWTRRHIDVSLVGQNLLEADHVEFDQIEGLFGSRIPRSLSMRLTLAF
jgi:iron complex outermembrane receptor protein